MSEEEIETMLAKCVALEKLVIELTLIQLSTGRLQHHHIAKLEQLLSDLQWSKPE